MKLSEFFDLISNNPTIVIFYVIALPLTAYLSCVFGKGEGHLSPWKYVHSVLIYLACIPGIFAIVLNLYLFVFERQSIMDTNLYTQILPIITMMFTLMFISKNVPLKSIPGFGKVSGLMIVLFSIFILMWIMEKTRLLIFSYMPIQYVGLLFLAILIAVMYGFRKFVKDDSSAVGIKE